nr:unnamed protein product [Spirometra erinaceieuropaei]
MEYDIFRQIWLDKLPVPMQQVLSMLDTSISLDKVSSHADRISECYPVGATCANIQPTSVPDRSDRVTIFRPEVTPPLERDTCVERSACRCSSRRATTPPRHQIHQDHLTVPTAAIMTISKKLSDPHAQRILTTAASNSAVGAVLHEQVNNRLQPLAFFSQKLQPAQTRYSTFSRELLAIYLAIRHFRHLLEGRDFSVHADHKPLTYALKTKPDRDSPREVRHLDYISQFTADIRYVRGSDNVVADALSRPDINTLTSDFDLAKLADLQSGDKTIDDLRSTTTLQLRDAPLPVSPGTILCDWSTGTPRPVVPLSFRKTVFKHFHSLSHPGNRASRKLIAARFIWPTMNSDIALGTK